MVEPPKAKKGVTLCSRLLQDRAREAYASLGVPDVASKRSQGARLATVWGAEVQGARGRVGVPRVKRAALSALTH